MEIIYLKKLEKNKTIMTRTIRGISESEISEVEKRLNIKFPTAYKEFLYLAGDSQGRLNFPPGATDIESLSKESYQKVLYKRLEDYNVNLERPFWVFTEMDGFQQFLFFYLDEGTDDPTIHQAEMTDITKFVSSNTKFSKFMDGLVDQSISIAKRGY